MGTGAAHAHGTIVARQDGGSGSFTDVGELRDITFPELTRAVAAVSSQADSYDHYVASGLLERSEFSFGIWWDPNDTTHDDSSGLINSIEQKQLDAWRFTEPGNATLIVSGYIVGFSVSAPMDDGLQADVTVQPTAAHAWNIT